MMSAINLQYLLGLKNECEMSAGGEDTFMSKVCKRNEFEKTKPCGNATHHIEILAFIVKFYPKIK